MSLQTGQFAEKSKKNQGHTFINQQLSYVDSACNSEAATKVIRKVAEVFDENQHDFSQKFRQFWTEIRIKLTDHLTNHSGTGSQLTAQSFYKDIEKHNNMRNMSYGGYSGHYLFTIMKTGGTVNHETFWKLYDIDMLHHRSDPSKILHKVISYGHFGARVRKRSRLKLKFDLSF